MLGHIYCVGPMTMLPNKSFNYAKLIIHLVIKGRVSGIFLRNNCICSNHALCFPVCFFLFSSRSHSQAVKYCCFGTSLRGSFRPKRYTLVLDETHQVLVYLQCKHICINRRQSEQLEQLEQLHNGTLCENRLYFLTLLCLGRF